ncbi:MAG: hypothetical protein FP831_03755 [Anaerolineae bacterium]|nr:hypothetical protein [Anaerolineae bacterium]
MIKNTSKTPAITLNPLLASGSLNSITHQTGISKKKVRILIQERRYHFFLLGFSTTTSSSISSTISFTTSSSTSSSTASSPAGSATPKSRPQAWHTLAVSSTNSPQY